MPFDQIYRQPFLSFLLVRAATQGAITIAIKINAIRKSRMRTLLALHRVLRKTTCILSIGGISSCIRPIRKNIDIIEIAFPK